MTLDLHAEYTRRARSDSVYVAYGPMLDIGKYRIAVMLKTAERIYYDILCFSANGPTTQRSRVVWRLAPWNGLATLDYQGACDAICDSAAGIAGNR
jgi:hypothetical protein